MRVSFAVGSMLLLAALACGDDSGGNGGAGGAVGPPIGGATGTGGAMAVTGGTMAGTAGMGGTGTTPGCEVFEAMAMPGTPRGTHDTVAAILRGDGTPTNMFGSCAFSSCHQGAAPRATLNLTEMPDITPVLVNVPSCQAEGLDRVEPGDPSKSWLWIKLAGPFDSSGAVTHSATPKTCAHTLPMTLGLGMPMTGGVPMWEPERLFQVCSWIADGAPGPTM